MVSNGISSGLAEGWNDLSGQNHGLDRAGGDPLGRSLSPDAVGLP